MHWSSSGHYWSIHTFLQGIWPNIYFQRACNCIHTLYVFSWNFNCIVWLLHLFGWCVSSSGCCSCCGNFDRLLYFWRWYLTSWAQKEAHGFVSNLHQIFLLKVSWINSWRPHWGFQCQGRLCRCQNLWQSKLCLDPSTDGWQPVNLRVVNLPTW